MPSVPLMINTSHFQIIFYFSDYQNFTNSNKTNIYFSEIPVPYLTHIDVVDAGLEVLENGIITSVTIESLRFMNNKIKIVEDNIFG